MNADGAADGTDLWLLDSELKANGERSLTNPNGPVQYFWDVNGDRDLTWADLELDLRYQTGTLQGEAPKSGGGKTTGSGDGGITALSGGYTVALDPVGSVNENGPFSLVGTVSPTPPPGTMFMPTVNWGQSPGNGGPPLQVMIDSSGHFQIPHIYYDDGASPGNGAPSDVETLTLSGDILGSPVSAQTTATVNNVAPVPQLGLVNSPVLGGPTYQMSGMVQDASPIDKHTITIDWGDGSAPTIISNLSTNQQFNNLPHGYAARQQHEGPMPYVVSATVVDDDTGTASWGPVQAPMYVLDLDNDANNNGVIEPADDPIEDVLPGRYLFVNVDDDNQNSVPDLQESPVSSENDLKELQLDFTPPNRPDVDNYNGWHVTLDVLRPQTTASGSIWEFPNKSGTSVSLGIPSGVLGHWIVGQSPAFPDSLYVEAASTGEIWLQLRLWTPNQGLVVDTDTIVFTAIAAPTVDLDTDSDNTKVIEESALEDQDEHDHGNVVVPGKIVLRNTDDDNGNDVQDRQDPAPFVDGQGNPVNDNELVPIKLKLGAGADDLPGHTVTLVPSGQQIKVWKTLDKQSTPLSWAVAEMPSVLYVEGVEFGQPTLEMQLKDATGAVVGAPDIVKFTVLTVDAIAFRPFSFFSPLTTGFIPVPVPIAEEETGVGIRRNGDGDVDPPTGEDDLIRVDLFIGIHPPPAGIGRKVGRSNHLIDVWDNDNRTGGILTGQTGNLADVPAGSQSVYVDWWSSNDGPSTFEFSVWDTLHDQKAFYDEILFKPFKSIVIVFVGEFEDPTDPPQNGTSAFAVEEYQKSGRDVHLFDEDIVQGNGTGEPYNEIVTAINDRGVTEVAIIGYSHGGGSAHFLAHRLFRNVGDPTAQPPIPPDVFDITQPFTIPFTSYIDAIVNSDDLQSEPERRRPCYPVLCKYHLNQYQRNLVPEDLFLRGDTTIYLGGADEEVNRTTTTTHTTIDDNEAVHTRLRNRLREMVEPF